MPTDQHDPTSCPTCRGSFRTLVRNLRQEAEESRAVAPGDVEPDVTEPGGTVGALTTVSGLARHAGRWRCRAATLRGFGSVASAHCEAAADSLLALARELRTNADS